jgi:hypothetical protein
MAYTIKDMQILPQLFQCCIEWIDLDQIYKSLNTLGIDTSENALYLEDVIPLAFEYDARFSFFIFGLN